MTEQPVHKHVWNNPAAFEPVLSIVIVTYNAKVHLEQCLQSILKQPFGLYELLVFDGNSTDGTIHLLTKYQTQINYWQSEPDLGIYYAMNKSLNFVKGKWIYFIGADDMLTDDFSKAALLLKNSSTIYYGYCYKEDQITNGLLTPYEVAKINICHQAVFYPKSVFETYRYNTRFIVYADHALNIKCWGNATWPKKYLSLPIARFNSTGFSSFTKDRVFEAEKTEWIKKYMSRYIYIRYLIRKWKARRKKEKDFI